MSYKFLQLLTLPKRPKWMALHSILNLDKIFYFNMNFFIYWLNFNSLVPSNNLRLIHKLWSVEKSFRTNYFFGTNYCYSFFHACQRWVWIFSLPTGATPMSGRSNIDDFHEETNNYHTTPFKTSWDLEQFYNQNFSLLQVKNQGEISAT